MSVKWQVSSVLHFSTQEEDSLVHTKGECHLCALWSTCRPLWNIDTQHHDTIIQHAHHVISVSHVNVECCKVTNTNGEVVNHQCDMLAYASKKGT